jgi:hypothetical protein
MECERARERLREDAELLLDSLNRELAGKKYQTRIRYERPEWPGGRGQPWKPDFGIIEYFDENGKMITSASADLKKFPHAACEAVR